MSTDESSTKHPKMVLLDRLFGEINDVLNNQMDDIGSKAANPDSSLFSEGGMSPHPAVDIYYREGQIKAGKDALYALFKIRSEIEDIFNDESEREN